MINLASILFGCLSSGNVAFLCCLCLEIDGGLEIGGREYRTRPLRVRRVDII